MPSPEKLIHESRVLVVDDEPTVVSLLAEFLSQGNLVVSTAHSAEEALEVMHKQQLDVVVTDVCMDGMSGFDLLEECKKHDPLMNVIIMTAHDSYDMVKQALQGGAYDYMRKPLENHETVVSIVARASAASKLKRQNAYLLEQLSTSHAMLADANDRLRELNDELMVLAATDSLTELHNRRHIDNTLEYEVSRRNRYPDPFSVVMIDIDRFKDFNDEYGHEGGDIALQSISKILRSCVRNTDVVGRFGGEEFVVILPKTHPANARTFAERMRAALEASRIMIDDQPCAITASFGVTGVDADYGETSAVELLNAADRALYAAKHAGRNCVKEEYLLSKTKFRKAS